jgi:Fur family ferric uptake transcriptional regulator
MPGPPFPRRTPQRGAIRRCFAAADRPLSPREVQENARREIPSLGLATVYRQVRSLLDEGWLRAVALPGAPDRYEVAGKGHHHHFHCRACDGLFDVTGCPGGIQALAPGGFLVERHEVILYGLCLGCRS